MSWSAEELFIRAYAAGAGAAQGVWDLVKGVERITKPKRRTGFDEDAAGEYLGGAEQLAEREAEEECSEPTVHHSPRDWTDVRLGHYNVHVEDGQPYRFGRDIKVGEQYCAICGDLLGAGYHTCPVLAAQRASADDTPNPTEPGLDDSELVAVRVLLQERYGDQSERADTQDAQMWRAFVDPDSSAASTVGDSAGAVSEPPSPAPACPRVACTKDPECERAGGLCENVRECGSAYPDDDAAEWIGGAVPTIIAVLAKHYPYVIDGVVVRCGGRLVSNSHMSFDHLTGWHEHIAPLIANAPAPQPKPAFPETGLDMGARLDGASEFFPQHRNSK